MKDIQVQKQIIGKERRHFLIKLKIFFNISDLIMEIHVTMLKFEDICGNFHRYNGRHTNK